MTAPRKPTRAEKHARSRAAASKRRRRGVPKMGRGSTSWIREEGPLTLAMITSGGFVVITLSGYTYVELGPALLAAAQWCGIPLLAASWWLLRDDLRDGDPFWVRGLVWLGVAGMAAWCLAVVASALLRVNASEITRTERVETAVIRKHWSGGRSASSGPKLVVHLDGEEESLRVSRSRYRETEAGDTLAFDLHTGRFGWRFVEGVVAE